MTPTDKTIVPTSNDSQLATIDPAVLDAVVGGCGACGQTCAAGPAPDAAGAQVQGLSPLPGTFGR